MVRIFVFIHSLTSSCITWQNKNTLLVYIICKILSNNHVDLTLTRRKIKSVKILFWNNLINYMKRVTVFVFFLIKFYIKQKYTVHRVPRSRVAILLVWYNDREGKLGFLIAGIFMFFVLVTSWALCISWTTFSHYIEQNIYFFLCFRVGWVVLLLFLWWVDSKKVW